MKLEYVLLVLTLNSTSQPAVKSGQIPVHIDPTAISGINHNLPRHRIEPTARFANGYPDRVLRILYNY